MKEDKTVTLHQSDFNKSEREAWTAFFEPWFYGEFRDCLKKGNFKMDCVDCGDIYFWCNLGIDKEGKLNSSKVDEENINCNNRNDEEINSLKDCMLQYFKTMQYPEPFHNKNLIVRIGEVSRC